MHELRTRKKGDKEGIDVRNNVYTTSPCVLKSPCATWNCCECVIGLVHWFAPCISHTYVPQYIKPYKSQEKSKVRLGDNMTWIHLFPFLLGVQLNMCTQRAWCNLSGCCGMGSMLFQACGSGTLTKFPLFSLTTPSLGSRNISQGSKISPSWNKVCKS
jgi:hypothetical protein